jgi:peptidoglycan-associated lipoprotein
MTNAGLSNIGCAIGLSALGLCLLSAGCAKKTVAAVPPPVAPVATQPAPVAETVPARPAPPAPRQQEPVAAVTPRPTTPDAQTRARIQDLLNRIEDAYFDYDKENIRADAQVALKADSVTLSEILKDYPTYKLTIEGYADERGSDQYNLALGDARSKRAKMYLTDAGIPDSQLLTKSFGKERQVCEEHNESCWQRNRRVHITQEQQ